MLDILLSRLKEEIAIDGSLGSNIDTIWEYVQTVSKEIAQESNVSITPLVDDGYKNFIWNYLRSEKDLEFYEDIGPADQEAAQIQATPPQDSQAVRAIAYNANDMEIDQEDGTSNINENPNTEIPKANLRDIMHINKEPDTSDQNRKQPPTSKKRASPLKKKAKAKPKKKRKTAKKVVAGDSDDDFEGGESNTESESEFENDVNESEEEEDDSAVSEEEYDDDLAAVNRKRKKNPNAVIKAAKKDVCKPKKIVAKANLRRIDDVFDLSYNQVTEMYGNRLHIIASIELQENQLFANVPPGPPLSPNLIIILQEILRARTKGLHQAQITKLLNIDSRSSGHYCKSLEEKGTIFRTGVSIDGMRTNICVHVKFVTSKDQRVDIQDEDHDDVPYNVNAKGKAFSQVAMRDALLDLIKDAQDTSILSEDVLRALGFDFSKRGVRKWFNRTINELCGKGYIKKTNLFLNGRIRRCLHLVKMPDDSVSIEEAPADCLHYPLRIKSIKKDVPILRLLVDSVPETQCLSVLTAAGENGITQKEIAFALNMDEPRIMTKLLERCCELTDVGLEHFGAVRVLEFEGKLRRYRYYTYSAFKKVHENEDVELAPLPEHELNESTFYERNYFVDTPHDKKGFSQFLSKSKESGSTKNIMSTAKTQKAPLVEGEEPKKRGRPKKLVDPNTAPPAKRKKYVTKKMKADAAAAAAAAAASSEGSNTANGSTEPAVALIEAPMSEGSSNANPVLLDDCEPIFTNTISITTPVPEGCPDNHLIVLDDNEPVPTDANLPGEVLGDKSSVSPVAETSLAQESPLPVAQETVTQSSRAVTRSTDHRLVETSVPADAIEIDSPDISVAKQLALPPKSAPEASSSKGNAMAKKATAPPSPPAATHNIRKKTIFDYFGKSSKKINDAPKPPEKEANQPAKEMDVTAESNTTDVSTTTEDEPIEIDKETAASVPETTPATKKTVRFADIVSSEKEFAAAEKEPTASTSEAPQAGVNTEVQEDIDNAEDVIAHIVQVTEPEIEATESDSEKATAADDQAETTSTTAEANIEERQVTIVPQTSTQKPSRTVAVFKKGGKHRSVGQQLNVYLEARIKVLLVILEEHPMVDIGKELTDRYTKIFTEMYGPPKHRICIKTMWRSAQILEERGLAQTGVIDCHLWNGKTTQRKVLMRHDVDREGEECKQFVSYVKDRRAIQVNYNPYEKAELVKMKVERLEERIPRMQEQMKQLVESGNAKEAKLLRNRIEELSGNVVQFGRIDDKKTTSDWMITAVQFGWVQARMIRCKLFHTYLFGLLDRQEPLPGVDKEKQEIATRTIIDQMPLKLVLQIIGVFSPPQHIVEYIRDPNNQHLTYKEIPENISGEIYSDRNRFRRRLRLILYGLEFLDLIKPNYIQLAGVLEEAQYSNIGSSYYIFREVPIKERYKKDQPVIRTHTIDSPADVALYWSELQYVCTNVEDELSEEEREPRPTATAFESEFWSGLHHVRNWSTATVYSRRQRKVLNSYVNKETGEVPSETSSIVNIAEEVELTVTSVRAYYHKVEAALARKNANTEMRMIERRILPTQRRPREQRNINQRGRRTINLSSTRAFRAPNRKLWNFTRPQITAESAALIDQDNQTQANQRARGENLYLDDVGNVPVLTNRTQNLRLTRSKRTVWTEDENELFIYSYAILIERSKKTRFLWSAVHNKVFPNKPTSRFRQHLTHILMNPTYVEQVDTATKIWPQFYREGIARGAIQDPDPRDTVNFDILGHLAYFLDRLSQKDTKKQDFYLPKKLEYLHDKFDITRGVAESQLYFIEDRYFETHTLVSQMNILYHQSLSARKLDEDTFDLPVTALIKESQIEERQRRLVRGYALMCLLTPSETYDPIYSYAVLSSFPKKLQQEVVKEMRTEGTLIQCKDDRPVPGTKYGLSSKFTSFMSGKLPKNFFAQAREYDKYLNQLGKNRFMADIVSSGMMGCTLSLLSDSKLDVSMVNTSLLMEKCETMTFNSRRTDRSLTVFDLDLEKNVTEDFGCTNLVPIALTTNVRNFDQLEIEMTNFLSSQEWYMKPLCREIIDVLQEQREVGLSLYDIKCKLKSGPDDDSIRRAIHLLSTHDPALICCVGFDAPRYILTIYTKTWTIHTSEIMSQFSMKFQNKIACSQQSTDSVKKKDLIVTNLWTDINGEVTEIVLKEVKEVVTEYILRRPGVTEASIYRHFSSALNRKEVHDLLDILVQQEVLKQVSICQPVQREARKNIFNKSHTLRCSTKQTIEQSIQTCYWVTADMYRHLA